MTILGVHTNAQNKPLHDLVSIWRHVDQLGYGWISISDHFPGSVGPMSNDAIAAHTIMAASTERARCGVLVYSTGFRHPAVLASAVATIDQFSGGRTAIGLGAGSVMRDYEIYGFPLLPIAERIDVLEESLRCVSGLLHEENFCFTGQHFRIDKATIAPRPIQDRLPVWIGTKGERRGLDLVARYADGWNIAFVTVDEFRRKKAVLDGHCARVGRDPDEVCCAINLLFSINGKRDVLPVYGRQSALVGSVTEILDGIERYTDAGADQINLNLSYPWDFDGLAELATALNLPAA